VAVGRNRDRRLANRRGWVQCHRRCHSVGCVLRPRPHDLRDHDLGDHDLRDHDLRDHDLRDRLRRSRRDPVRRSRRDPVRRSGRDRVAPV